MTKVSKCRRIPELLLNLTIELISTSDLISDGYLLYKFAQSKHLAWFTCIVQTIVWPYFISYVPFINFKITELRNKQIEGKKGLMNRLSSGSYITPLLLVYLFCVDVFFMILSSVGTPFMIFSQLFTSESVENSKIDEWMDNSF